MKQVNLKNSIKQLGLILSVSALVFSCTKTFDVKLVLQTDVPNNASVQVYIATVNAARNYVNVNGNNVTGALLTSGSLFPSTANSFITSAGAKSFLVWDTLRTTTQIPFMFSANMSAGKNYTVFMYDTINSPKQKIVETSIVIPTDTSARLRFANFVFSKTAIPAIDIYSANKKANIFTNVQLNDVTDFIPYPSGIIDTFYVRQTGTGVDLMNFTAAPANTPTPIRSIFTPTLKRSYTLVFRGSNTTTLTTLAQLRTLSVFANY